MADKKSKSDAPALDDLEARRSGQEEPKPDPKPAPKAAARLKPKDEPKDEPPAEEPMPAPVADATPLHTDPLLAPESQQPFESGEDYRRRMGKPEPRPGVYDESITRGEDPQR